MLEVEALSGTGGQSFAETAVFCADLHGRLTPVPSASLQFSLAVYGILIENNRVLLQVEPQTGLFYPLGGRFAAEQPPSQALRQLVYAATGISPVVHQLLLMREEVVLDGQKRAWRLSVAYYILERPLNGRSNLIDFDTAAKPEWLPVAKLGREQMQFGYDAIQLALGRMS